MTFRYDVAFLLLLCASQGFARFVDDDAQEVLSGSASVSPGASPTDGGAPPTNTPVPSPSISPEPKGSNKGLNDEDALLAVAIIMIVVMVIGVGAGLFFWSKGDAGTSGFAEWFNDVMGVWYRFFFRAMEGIIGIRGIKMMCYISSLLMVLLVIAGVAEGDGALLSGALFCFFVFIGLVSEKENARRLGFGEYSLWGFVLALGVFWIISVIAVPAKYFVTGEDNAAIIMLLILAWVPAVKPMMSLMQLRLETGVPLGGSSTDGGSGGGYDTVA